MMEMCVEVHELNDLSSQTFTASLIHLYRKFNKSVICFGLVHKKQEIVK